MKRSISLLLVITLLCGLLGTAAYAVPGQSAQSDENTEYLIFDGAPLMDISYGKDAGDQIAFAAREMRDTLKAVSGASVHIGVEDYESDQVSAFLLEDAVSVSENGAYPVFVSLANPGAQAVSVALEQTGGSPLSVEMEQEVALEAGQRKTVGGLLHVPAGAANGQYEVTLTAVPDSGAAREMQLSVDLNRNLIRNASFEDGESTVWDVGTVVTDQAHTGNCSMKLTLSGEWIIAAYTVSGLEPGQTYTFSAYVKSAADAELGIYSQFIEPSNIAPPSAQIPRAVTTDWTKVEWEYTTAEREDADSSSMQISLIINAYGSGEVWVDDLDLSIAGEDEPANLIPNADLESETQTFWYQMTPDDLQHHSGARSIRLERAANDAFTIGSAYLPLAEAGATYTFSAWVRGSEPDGRFYMQFLEDADGVISGPQTPTEVTDEWQRREWRYTVQSGNPYLYLHLIINADSPQSVWFNDFSLTVTPPESSAMPPDTGAQTPAAVPESTVGVSGEDGLHLVLATPESHPDVAALFPDDMAYLQDSDGFAVRRTGNTVYILGTEEKGVLNGVYDFLTEHTGILWTRARSSGTLYEAQADLALETYNYREKSPFEIRGWNLTGQGMEARYHSDDATERMLARNKLNSKLAEIVYSYNWNYTDPMGIEPQLLGHNLEFWLPNTPNFTEHPEWFNTDENGTPVPVSAQTQINFFSAEAADAVAENMIRFAETYGKDTIGIGINDNRNFRQNGLEKQPFTTEEGVTVEPADPAYLSTVYYTFLNRVARQVRAALPDVKIMTFAYFFTETPPKISDLEDNIVIVLAPITGDDREPMNTEKENPNNACHENLLAWCELTRNIILYHYYGCFLYQGDLDYERPIAKKVQADLQYYRDLGLLGILPEGRVDVSEIDWGVNALQFWLINQLFWDPDADLAALTLDFCRKAYGDAADDMLAYYALIEEGWNQFDDPVNYSTTNQTYYGKFVIQAGIAEAAQAALDRAWAAADPAARTRIRPIKESFERGVQSHEVVTASASYTDAGKEALTASFDFTRGPWAEAEVIDRFLISGTTEVPDTSRTETRLLWDETNLYVAYQNFDDKMESCVTTPVDPDTNWWVENYTDDVETFLAASPDVTGYRAFMSNSDGDRLLYENTVNGPVAVENGGAGWEAYGRRYDDRWAVIQVIPLAQFGVDGTSADAVYGYFFRSYHIGEEGARGVIAWCGAGAWSAADLREIKLTGRPDVPSGGNGAAAFCTVTFETNGGSETGRIRVQRGHAAAAPAEPEKGGYTFAGWFTDRDCTRAYDFSSRVTKNMTLYAKWIADTAEGQWISPFADVGESDWFHGAVRYVTANGLFRGTAADTFAPHGTVTRGMLVTVLWRAEQEPAAASAMTFTDVDPDAYYAAAVRWAASAGVAEGHSAAAFAPEEPVTREQAAAILERYAALRGAQPGNAGSLSPFADADCISPWARESAAWAVGAGILCGNGGGMLDPLGCLTRAEAAAMLQRLLEM